MTVVGQAVPKMKYKTFTYSTNLTWLGERAGMLRSPGKSEFRVASPPEFKGEAGVWTPEDMFVAAVETCTMTTFLAFAYRKGLPLTEYVSAAEGMLEFADGGYRFTKVILKPKIRVRTADAIEAAEKILHEAHRKCLISNSIKAEIEVKPLIESEA
jgi:peroxiredoxin-like protein